MAGLYQPVQRKSDGKVYNHFVVLTLAAADNVRFIHHRMPVLLNEETRNMWLDTNVDFDKCFKRIYESNPKDILQYYKVASVVNSVKNDSADCILEMEEYKKK